MNKEYKMTISKDRILEIYYNEYLLGCSMCLLGEKYSINPSYFGKWFKKLNLPVRSNKINSKKYSCNDDYFKEVNTQDKAYWLGFIYADGYINTKRKNETRKLGITLSSQDIKHLYKFKNCIESDSPVKEYISMSGYSIGEKYCRVLLTSENITNDLISLGVYENKTSILDSPILNNDLIKHFIRGYFDGDGSIWCSTSKKAKIEQYSIEFIGTDLVLQYIMNHLIQNNIIDREYDLNKRKENQVVSNFKFGGNNKSLKFLNYIYEDANIYLDRKYNKYLELQNLVNSRL